MDLLIARVLLEFYGVMIAYIVIAFIFGSFELYELPRDWAMFYIGWFQMLWFSAASAMIIGSLTEIYEWSEKLIAPFMYFMLPICGAFYMLDWLPNAAQDYLKWLPTVQAFEMIREGQFGGSANTHYSVAYASLVNTVLLAAGILMCRNVHRHMVIE
jgi:capsular polysaccharide transport system permease protein